MWTVRSTESRAWAKRFNLKVLLKRKRQLRADLLLPLNTAFTEFSA